MNDVSGLQNLIDELEGRVRNLKSLKVDTSSYGILLMPLINEKLPTDWLYKNLIMNCGTCPKCYAF